MEHFFNIEGDAEVKSAIIGSLVMLLATTPAIGECGIASTYSEGHITATGKPYNHMGISAAHKSLPFGTKVRVVNQRTGRSIILPITDRGPYIAGRIIDLSTGAKNKFGMGGLAPVCIQVVSRK